jgi:hypothetical protein
MRKGREREVKGRKAKAGRREVTSVRRGDPCDPRPHREVGHWGRRARRLRVPPPESDVWPPQYRGERWKRIYGMLFEGKCLLCQYGFSQPESRRKRDQWLRQDTPLLCANRAARRGDRWEAWIGYGGKWHRLGLYVDEVEAAKTRDREAVKAHGPYAYLNFPEDWTFDKNGVGHLVRAKAKPSWR